VIAAVHVHPAITSVLALLVAAVLGWYWHRMGDEHVPASRRRIRRISILCMLISLPMFIAALSLLDPAIHNQKRTYALAWTFALGMLLIIIITAVLDMMNNLRLHNTEQRRAALDSILKHITENRPQAPDDDPVDGEDADHADAAAQDGDR
jgi:cytochrome bd-type quinol oxidase subunit 2